MRSPTMRLRTLSLVCLAALASVLPASAQQGTTTGTFRGRVTADEQPVVGAQVVARNTATGVTRGTLTDAQGRYSIPLLQPGPYTLRVTSIGYADSERTSLNASSGIVTTVDISVSVQAVAIEGVEAVGERAAISQAGVATRVSTEQVENLPVAGRDFTDFLNLSPLVSPQPGIGTGGQFSIGGQRTSGTNVQIDGTDANNIYFGENRGSSRSPFAFSLESIREFQLITNGYDVEYGSYQGGVVNAVTKGGTNDFNGTAFYYNRGEALTSNDFLGGEPRDYHVHQFGASVSGPIMKDRLHFFVSADLQRKAQPIFALVPGQTPVTQDSLTRFLNALRTRYGITNPESYVGEFEQEENNTVLFGRADWTFSANHRLTLRQNYSDFIQTNDRLNPNEAITHTGPFKDKAYSSVAELNSVLGQNTFNTFRFQWSYEDRPRPPRDDGGSIPQFSVTGVGTGTNGIFGGDATIFRNRLEENKLQLIDNFNIRFGAHALKFGGNLLFGSNVNTFWLSGAGSFNFSNLTNFENGVVNTYTRSMRACPVPLVANAIGEVVVCPQYDVPLAEFSYTEYSLYAQDDIQLTDKLLVTGGVRYQGTGFGDDPAFTQIVADTFGYRTDEMPNFTGLSPRLSFTYGFGEQSVLRGGAALLIGRAPTVLAGNAISTERPLLSISCSGAAAPTLTPAMVQELLNAGDGSKNPAACRSGAAPTGRPEYTLFADDFKLPRTWKASVGVEHRFDWGTRLGLDLIYSRANNQFVVKDLNLGARSCQTQLPSGSLVNRDPEVVTECFGLANELNRPIYVPRAQYNPRFAASAGATANNRNTSNTFDRVYLNTSDGEAQSYNAQIILDHQLGEKLQFGAGYGWVHAFDNSSFSCCTSNEGFGSELTAGNPNVIGDVGDDGLLWGVSRFERRHTITANFMWRAPLGLRVSGIWRSQSGLPFTPVVDGDLNADGQSFNDRAIVSRNLQFTAAAELDTLNMLIDKWDCLEEQLDQIAKRNSCRGPWWHSLDLRLSKGFETVRGQRAELLVDLFNVLNGLNSDWGRYMGVFTASTNLLRAESYDPVTQRVRYTVNYTAAQPGVTERGFGVAQPAGFDPFQFQAQIGVRYRF
jgi:outer membrane receptor for ferrienterochelin and colicin